MSEAPIQRYSAGYELGYKIGLEAGAHDAKRMAEKSTEAKELLKALESNRHNLLMAILEAITLLEDAAEKSAKIL
ncbi:MAG: hypothetical protein MUP44_08065 [Anaerolineales bacterium]|nr:hypothetical protein [Anaerolineales bacterium]